MKKYVVYLCVAILSLCVGILFEPNVRNVSLSGLIDAKMSDDGSVFLLECNKLDQYEIEKINKSGKSEYNIKLDQKVESFHCVYKHLCIDENNAYVVRSLVEKEENQKDRICREEVVRYAVDGVSLGAVAEVKPDNEYEELKYPVINQIQAVGGEIKLLCNKGNVVYVLSVDKSGKDRPKEVNSFFLEDYQETDTSFISDAVITSDNKVTYVDKRGNMYSTDSNNQFYSVNSEDDKNFVPASLSIDKNNFVFFTDLNNEDFCKFDTVSGKITKLYSENSIINDKKNISFKDLQFALAMPDENDFYGIVKFSNKSSYVQFGNNQNTIEKIKYNQNLRLLEVIIVSLVSFGIIMGLILIFKKFVNFRILSVKMFSQILVAVIVACTILVSTIGYLMVYTERTSLCLYNQAGLDIMINFINEANLESTDFLKDYASAEYDNINNDIASSFSKVKTVNDNMNIYSVRNGNIYRLYEFNNTSGINAPNFKLIDLPKIPIKYVMDTDTYEKYYSVLATMNRNYNKDYFTLTTVDEFGKWISVIKPIKNSSNQIIGLIESKFSNFPVQSKSGSNLFLDVIFLLLLFSFIIMIFIYVLFKISLRPLKTIKSGILSVKQGVYDNKLDIFKKDQLGDICNDINDMSESVYKKVSSLVLINEEYTKYTPKEIFMQVGKDDITDISLNDKIERSVFLLTINLIGKKTLSDLNMSNEEYFDIIHENISDILTTVGRNDGFVQQFNAFSISVLFFKHSSMLRAAFELMDVIKNEKILSNVKISMCSESAVIGTLGNDDRKNIIVVSNMQTVLEKFIYTFKNFPNRCILTQDIFDLLEEKDKEKYRCIGLVNDSFRSRMKIYELLNVKDKSEKNIFDQALNLFIKGDFENAGKKFINVLCINRNDRVSMYYLKKCDEYLKEKVDNWSGFIM